MLSTAYQLVSGLIHSNEHSYQSILDNVQIDSLMCTPKNGNIPGKLNRAKISTNLRIFHFEENIFFLQCERTNNE